MWETDLFRKGSQFEMRAYLPMDFMKRQIVCGPGLAQKYEVKEDDSMSMNVNGSTQQSARQASMWSPL